MTELQGDAEITFGVINAPCFLLFKPYKPTKTLPRVMTAVLRTKVLTYIC